LYDLTESQFVWLVFVHFNSSWCIYIKSQMVVGRHWNHHVSYWWSQERHLATITFTLHKISHNWGIIQY